MTFVGQVVKLTTTPSAWANLSFEVGGILQTSNATLDQQIEAPYDFTTLYGALGVSTETLYLPGAIEGLAGRVGATGKPILGGGGIRQVPEPANLLNSSDLGIAVEGSELMSLRAESIKAMLDKACALRANIYYAKFANQDNIIAAMKTNLTAANNYLTHLMELSTTQVNTLTAAYGAADPIYPHQSKLDASGVAKMTSSSLYAQVTNASNVTQSQDNQTMNYEDYGYRMPKLEADAQNTRAQLSLMAESFAQFMAAQPNTGDHFGAVFANELAAIDMDVKRLQVAYLNTILLPPISGTVTGIYKQVGEAVLPGETVMRIEDTSTIYLVGTLICRQMIPLQSPVTIQANNLFSSGNNATFNNGSVIAARGDDRGDDWWNVVISCPNSAGGASPAVPPNYTFDYENTTVTIG